MHNVSCFALKITLALFFEAVKLYWDKSYIPSAHCPVSTRVTYLLLIVQFTQQHRLLKVFFKGICCILQNKEKKRRIILLYLYFDVPVMNGHKAIVYWRTNDLSLTGRQFVYSFLWIPSKETHLKTILFLLLFRVKWQNT